MTGDAMLREGIGLAGGVVSIPLSSIILVPSYVFRNKTSNDDYRST